MAKLLWLLAIVLLVLWLLRPRRSSPPPATGDAERRAATDIEDMVRCERCSLHLPRNDALRSGDAYFCCEAHRREHVAGRTSKSDD
jgi:uncharacterized protein